MTSGILSAMKPVVYGHGWGGAGRAFPRLFSAMHISLMFTGLYPLRYSFWVADYAVNTAGRVRVASRSRPWRQCLARTLHRYPPNTVYWEDYPRGRKTLCEYSYVFFNGGEGARLDRLIDPRAGYARFVDP
ncbi:MAG: hypothetical protein FJ225_09635 [Lentisphaerae bacterium]|nr:hypothetical protein [Lentisphaerota bacterium]